MREASPYFAFGQALVVVGRHEDCSRILRDPRMSSDRARSLLSPPGTPSLPTMVHRDPPDHTRLRRLVSKAFTPRVVASLAPRIRRITGDLISAAAVAGAGQIEVVSQLAYPLTIRMISELLGVPAADQSLFAGWTACLAQLAEPQAMALKPADAAAMKQVYGEFSQYFTDLIAQRRARPERDLLSALIRARDEGQQLTELELIRMCMFLLVAGHETTVNLISNAIVALLRHPDQLAALRADQELAGAAVEETLRYSPSLQMASRVARGNIEIGDLTAPDGAMVVLLLAAAGRDPAVFPEPDKFDISRDAGRHLAFAAGPHFCLGAPLARLEATIALNAFAARVVTPELDPAQLAYKPNMNVRGPSRLVVGFSEIRAARRPARPRSRP
jgi:hypothetical protein